MNKEEWQPCSDSDHVIKRGARYEHAEHGRVEVTDVWHGSKWVDVVHNADGQETIVVRFLPPEGDSWHDELSEPVTDFLEATNLPDLD